MTKMAARLEDGRLVLENDCIRRTLAWNGGNPSSIEFAVSGGAVWPLAGAKPDLEIPGLPSEGEGGELAVEALEATAWLPAHLRAVVTAKLGPVEVRRVYRLYDGVPAVVCDIFLRGRAEGSWLDGAAAAGSLANIENIAAASHGALRAPTAERFATAEPHLQVRCSRFYDITDRRNTLVESAAFLPYRGETRRAGNLLLAWRPMDGEGFFMLKEAPCSDVQLAWPGCDFAFLRGELRAVGLGVEPGDLKPLEWVRAYGVVTGLASGGEEGLLLALRSYQERARVSKPGRDHSIMLNTWGDRGQDGRISAEFALRELERGARLGVTHFQLDDGWQEGQSSNSASPGGTLEGIWSRPGYWKPHAVRFPRGLGPVAERARELGIELCLWFNPSKDGSYAHWADDADALVGLNREHGIRTFKIDGVMLPDKAADDNLRRLFDRVMEATGGEAVFNLDVTAGRRWGYHLGVEYGNIFVENRYTDWVNYYPHWTLRNLWMLSLCVPPQRLQMEFLNPWRNREKYPEGDALAPARVPFDYCFAVTMPAQPLAWMEAQGLPEEAFAAAPVIREYLVHQERIHAGRIMPVGEEPSGAGWTGFQSIGDGRGYFIMYRELNERPGAAVRAWGLAGRTVEFRPVLGRAEAFTAEVGEDGLVTFALPGPFTFGVWEYAALGRRQGSG